MVDICLNCSSDFDYTSNICPCAYYKLDETSATANAIDSSGNGLNIPFVAGSSGCVAASGKIKGARDLTDATGPPSAYFARTSPESCFDLKVGNKTVWGWFKFPTGYSAVNFHIVSLLNDSYDLEWAVSFFPDVWVEGTDFLDFSVGLTGGGNYRVQSANNITLDAWHFFAAWITNDTNPPTLHLRVDNAVTTAQVGSSIIGDLGGIRSVGFDLPASAGGGNPLLIDEIGFISRELTTAELDSLYNNGNGNRPSCNDDNNGCLGCVDDIFQTSNDMCPCVYYKCDEDTGQNLVDAFGNYDLTHNTVAGSGSIKLPGVLNSGRGANGYFSLGSVTEPCFSIQNTGGTFAGFIFDNAGSTGHQAISKQNEWYIQFGGTNPSAPTYNLNYAEFGVYTNMGLVTVDIGEAFGDFRINFDEWFLVVAWVNHAEEKIYLRIKSKRTPANDITRSTSYAGQTLASIASGNVYVGYGSAIAHGEDELGLYNRNLTVGEQNRLYNVYRPDCIPSGSCLVCTDEWENPCPCL